MSSFHHLKSNKARRIKLLGLLITLLFFLALKNPAKNNNQGISNPQPQPSALKNYQSKDCRLSFDYPDSYQIQTFPKESPGSSLLKNPTCLIQLANNSPNQDFLQLSVYNANNQPLETWVKEIKETYNKPNNLQLKITSEETSQVNGNKAVVITGSPPKGSTQLITTFIVHSDRLYIIVHIKPSLNDNSAALVDKIVNSIKFI